jgi:hypothetical protein
MRKVGIRASQYCECTDFFFDIRQDAYDLEMSSLGLSIELG